MLQVGPVDPGVRQPRRQLTPQDRTVTAACKVVLPSAAQVTAVPSAILYHP
jgi:hypothetical protein